MQYLPGMWRRYCNKNDCNERFSIAVNFAGQLWYKIVVESMAKQQLFNMQPPRAASKGTSSEHNDKKMDQAGNLGVCCRFSAGIEWLRHQESNGELGGCFAR